MDHGVEEQRNVMQGLLGSTMEIMLSLLIHEITLVLRSECRTPFDEDHDKYYIIPFMLT